MSCTISPAFSALKPDWIEGASRKYPAELYLTGVGYGDGRKAAEDSAVIAKIFQVIPQIARNEGIAESGYRVVVNTNRDAGQAVHYIDQGVEELDPEKLPDLLVLKYRAIPDAKAILGELGGIRELFVGFQRHLYEKAAVA